MCNSPNSIFFFFNDTATTEIYTLSLHDALPISFDCRSCVRRGIARDRFVRTAPAEDRKSTRLNSSHQIISYAVFCLKKKKKRVVSQRARPQIIRNKKKTTVKSAAGPQCQDNWGT